MKLLTFPLSSDQLELLLNFEEGLGLTALAEKMSRDPSVISRNLQKIAEKYPLLVKIKGRWELTPLGYQVNIATKESINNYQKLISNVTLTELNKKTDFSKSCLIVINAQIGLLDATQPGRNNTDAETNISKLLNYWRVKKRPVIHIKHVSENVNSIFYRNSKGIEFLDKLQPEGNEIVIEKMKSSAFTETLLENSLKQLDSESLVLVGFTANECIDATARDSSALGIETYVIGDATAMFDMHSPEGKLLKADRLHKLTLANINALYAKVINVNDVIA